MVSRPKIGVIVDGKSELHIQMLFEDWPDCPVLKPLIAQTDPKAKPQKQAIEIVKAIRNLRAVRCNDIIVLFDLEDQECPGVKAQALQDAIRNELRKQYIDAQAPRVNYKVRKLENWLIADFEGASRLKWLNFSSKVKGQIMSGADNIFDACRVLDEACSPGTCYSKDKPEHFKEIAPRLRTQLVAQRSPSFKRFIRLLGWQEQQAEYEAKASASD